MLTEEEWQKRESNEGKLFFTREEWLKHNNKGAAEGQSSQFRNRVVRDKSREKCFNCYLYGHFAAECRKPKRNREQRQEANLVQIEDDEPALLLAKHDKDDSKLMLLDETDVRPRLMSNDKVTKFDSNLWYLDNGASNHMTGKNQSSLYSTKESLGV